jgi:hypothetical protein
MIQHTARLALLAFCIGLAGIIVGEQVLSVAVVEASTAYAEPMAPAASPPPAVDTDAIVAKILERPLFTASRRAPRPPEAPAPPPPTAPELKARLAGMLVGPDDKQALFAREGGAVVAVREQQEIDGWTVTAIDIDKVVVSSTFGERVLQPTPGAAGAALRSGARGATPQRRPNPTQSAGSAPNQPARPNIAPAPAMPGRPPVGNLKAPGNNPRS